MSIIKTLEWTDDGVRFIDQTKLPTQEIYVTCKTYEEVADAISTMIVRGAPAIGVAAGMGVALGVRDAKAETVDELGARFDEICKVIGATRPTAVNLFWAIRRMQDKFAQLQRQAGRARSSARSSLKRNECTWKTSPPIEAMGKHGAVLLPARGGVLTHCNAGALATAGYGTALGVIRAAVESGKEAARLRR